MFCWPINVLYIILFRWKPSPRTHTKKTTHTQRENDTQEKTQTRCFNIGIIRATFDGPNYQQFKYMLIVIYITAISLFILHYSRILWPKINIKGEVILFSCWLTTIQELTIRFMIQITVDDQLYKVLEAINRMYQFYLITYINSVLKVFPIILYKQCMSFLNTQINKLDTHIINYALCNWPNRLRMIRKKNVNNFHKNLTMLTRWENIILSRSISLYVKNWHKASPPYFEKG